VASRARGHLLGGGDDRRDDLVPQHAWGLGNRHLPIEQVQVGAAHPAGVYLQQQLARGGLGDRALHEPQRLADALEDHGAHVVLPVWPGVWGVQLFICR
jgi:hypothetical protein